MRRRAKQRQTAASQGERHAKDMLRAKGFSVLDEQVRAPLYVRVDGRLVRHEVRADLLVERRGKRFIAEVKTGDLAPSIAHGPTRRQLLEYSLVYPVSGTLLVDVPGQRIHHIDFPTRFSGPKATQHVLRIALAALAGALAYHFWLRPLSDGFLSALGQ